MIDQLFADHLRQVQKNVEQTLADLSLESVVLHSGKHHYYFGDDQYAPFRTNPNFAYCSPLSGPGHVVVFRANQKPKLIWFSPEDYWYEPTSLGEPYWLSEFETIKATSSDVVKKEIGSLERIGFVGEDIDLAESCGLTHSQVNPDRLVQRLHWMRSYKTPYEVHCIEEANRLGAEAHRAARTVFETGGTELDIHYAYVKAIKALDCELPYESIIALDEKGAFLHYVNKRPDVSGQVLLLDSGATFAGYASDITRTWTSDSVDSGFKAMRDDFDRLELELCDQVRPGLNFVDLHRVAHEKIATFLSDHGILTVPGAEAFERGLTHPFFPHGLGHFLGIQVHDVSGHQENQDGGQVLPPEEYPFLRTTRTLDVGHVITIEPGVYFIEMLLRPFRSSPDSTAFNWERIDQLSRYGGLRTEDDVLVTSQGHTNLTRPFHPE